MSSEYKIYIEKAIIEQCKIRTADSKFKGFFPKEWVISIILSIAFETVGWNKRLNKFATKFTISEDYDIRYYLKKSFDEQEIGPEDLITEDKALAICNKILDKMVTKEILEFSKSTKAVRYLNR